MSIEISDSDITVCVTVRIVVLIAILGGILAACCLINCCCWRHFQVQKENEKALREKIERREQWAQLRKDARKKRGGQKRKNCDLISINDIESQICLLSSPDSIR